MQPIHRRIANYLAVMILGSSAGAAAEPAGRAQRLDRVLGIPGLVAFWDFVEREDGPRGGGRFVSLAARPGDRRFVLEPRNISRDFWHQGTEATQADFPLLGRGPFGQAVQFRNPRDKTDLPVLEVPRAALHDTGLDAKGPGRSVTLVVWLVNQGGNHAIAGIWHEGTDTPGVPERAAEVVPGQRQYGLFAGLAANPGAVSPHVSDNGLASFGQKYAYHMSVTEQRMARAPSNASQDQLDAAWSVAGLVYDNQARTVTSYLNGVASEYWIERPAANGFYQKTAIAWRQTRLARHPELPRLPSDDRPALPPDQFYEPPEDTPLAEVVVEDTADRRTVLRSYAFTKVRTTYRKDVQGRDGAVTAFELVALKANPYWFGHDLHAPAAGEGGPFTIGRVIHSNRHATLAACFGGVAVYDRPLRAAEMAGLAAIGRTAALAPVDLVDLLPR